MNERNYWIGVVSRDHVELGTAGEYVQLNHGKAGPLERMAAGDGFCFYSPRIAHPDGAPLQAFTAIGRIRSGAVYQAASGDLRPFRLDADYLPATTAPIRPLIDDALVHPQQEALGRRVPLRRRPRAAGGLRADRRSDGPRVRRGLPTNWPAGRRDALDVTLRLRYVRRE